MRIGRSPDIRVRRAEEQQARASRPPRRDGRSRCRGRGKAARAPARPPTAAGAHSRPPECPPAPARPRSRQVRSAPSVFPSASPPTSSRRGRSSPPRASRSRPRVCQRSAGQFLRSPPLPGWMATSGRIRARGHAGTRRRTATAGRRGTQRHARIPVEIERQAFERMGQLPGSVVAVGIDLRRGLDEMFDPAPAQVAREEPVRVVEIADDLLEAGEVLAQLRVEHSLGIEKPPRAPRIRWSAPRPRTRRRRPARRCARSPGFPGGPRETPRATGRWPAASAGNHRWHHLG